MSDSYETIMDTGSSPKLPGLLAGLIAFFLMLLFFKIDGLDRSAEIVAAVAVLMAIWWATEAIPLPMTALLPLIAFPLSGVLSSKAAAAPYANPIIFLFLGGFLVALAIERCGLHRRIALNIFKRLGQSGARLVGGFMMVAALLSMWISNTSTTLMLFPIAMSLGWVVAETTPGLTDKEKKDFNIALLLGLAYGASIGGVATLVGTPTNVFMVGFLQSEYGIEIPFVRWMMIGLPATIILLPIGWFMLTKILFKVNFISSDETKAVLAERLEDLGSMSRAEKRTAVLFALLVLGWVLRKQIATLTGLPGLSDTGVAMLAALAAFIIPSGTDDKALVDWEDTKRLPWGVLILFGGGLSLAAALSSSGLTLWLGQQLAPLGAINHVVLVVSLTAMVVFLTELTSNVATTATLLPVMAALAVQLGIDPLIFVVPVTLAASCAFMLPVATPPNAIVFSTGQVTIKDMMRAGLGLNIVAIMLLSLWALYLVPRVL
jgi:sodium-dependent dicarboxylate transporter 2/3/5